MSCLCDGHTHEDPGNYGRCVVKLDDGGSCGCEIVQEHKLSQERIGELKVLLYYADAGHLSSEEDGAISSKIREVYRVVGSKARQHRREQNTSARPDYEATVYSSEYTSLMVHAINHLPALLTEICEARELIKEVDHVYDWLLRGSHQCTCGDCRQCWADITAERTRQYLKEIEPPVTTLLSTATTKFSHDKRSLVIEQDGKEIRIERADLPEGLASMIFVACKEQISGSDIKKHCVTLDVAPDYLKDLPF